jgi:uncharacterized membrane protein YphA (DoxX/SURF4 family)
MSRRGRARLAAAWLLGLGLAGVHLWGGLERVALAGLGPAGLGGYPSWMFVVVGVAELVGGLALLVPKAASYAALALSVVAAGRIGALAHEGWWADMPEALVRLVALTWMVCEWWEWRAVREPVSAQGDHRAASPAPEARQRTS